VLALTRRCRARQSALLGLAKRSFATNRRQNVHTSVATLRGRGRTSGIGTTWTWQEECNVPTRCRSLPRVRPGEANTTDRRALLCELSVSDIEPVRARRADEKLESFRGEGVKAYSRGVFNVWDASGLVDLSEEGDSADPFICAGDKLCAGDCLGAGAGGAMTMARTF